MNDMSLSTKWIELKKQNPKVRIRDAALALNTSEMALVVTGCGMQNIRLKPDFKEILERLESLGSVMALTRSDHAVHESHGVYQEMKSHGSVAFFFRPGIDARFFLDKWASAFAVNENDRDSLQFFDSKGDAVHKIYVTNETNYEEFSKLVQNFKSDNQEPFSEIQLVLTPDNTNQAGLISSIQEAKINPEKLTASWLAIRDVHEAGKIIKAYGNHRRNEIYQALGTDYAVPLAQNSIEEILETASRESVEIMIFAMNEAAVQIYSGAVKKLLRTGPWFNILDPGFNLHLRTECIGEIWMVKKPTEDGWVTSIDILDENGIEFLLIADNRVLGESESTAWQDICNNLIAEKNNKADVA